MRCTDPYYFLILVSHVSSLKFLVYNPIIARSHVNYIGKLAEVLVDGGHDVTMLAPVYDSKIQTVGTDKVKQVIKPPQSEKAKVFEKTILDQVSKNFWEVKSFTDTLDELFKYSFAMGAQCNETIKYPGLLDNLKNERFDAAIAEPLDICSIGIFHYLGIEKFAMTSSLGSFEGSFYITGVPSFPSYVPGFMQSMGEKMTFSERVQNTISLFAGRHMFPRMFEKTDAALRANFGPAFPTFEQLSVNCSFFFVNAEPLIEFPRVINHKLIDIGGISVSTGHKPLNKTWSDILDRRSKNVLISFGTVAKSNLMPDNYKQSIKEAIRRFPDVTFIWKYERPEDKISEGIDNLIESTWVPQNDMLYDRRLSLFITHGGQGSITEATTAGVPLIVIPIMADQLRNGAVIKRIGTGVVLEKDALGNSKDIEKALKDVLTKSEYVETARYVGETIRNRPFTPRQIFLRNMEFMARYGPLRQLDHYGMQLNFVQYYLIDVFAFLAASVLIFIFILLKIVKFIVLKCLGMVKAKRD